MPLLPAISIGPKPTLSFPSYFGLTKIYFPHSNIAKTDFLPSSHSSYIKTYFPYSMSLQSGQTRLPPFQGVTAWQKWVPLYKEAILEKPT
jgi:hypothetical protein